MIYRLIGFLFVGILSLQITLADLQSDIIPAGSSVLSGSTASQSGTGLLDAILLYIKDSVFGLMALVAIGVFLWIGGRLILARGNPEQFKKAWMQFIYAIVGIFIVAFSWAAVRLVVGLNF